MQPFPDCRLFHIYDVLASYFLELYFLDVAWYTPPSWTELAPVYGVSLVLYYDLSCNRAHFVCIQVNLLAAHVSYELKVFFFIFCFLLLVNDVYACPGNGPLGHVVYIPQAGMLPCFKEYFGDLRYLNCLDKFSHMPYVEEEPL